jgi:octaprenyl-diphosphate synthase
VKELHQVTKQINNLVLEIDDKKSLELFNLLATGKMLRSKLILKIAGINEKSIKLCAVVEMIHAASLLHDDVIDEADTRRGNASINSLFDNKTAIMFGDILYSKAFLELSAFGERVSAIVSSAVVSLSIGEMMDMDLANGFNTDIDLFMDMLYKKTASLIEASAKSAAIISGKDDDKFALYGKNLGVSFQLVDDILDIEATSKQLGKPALSDFKEGKVTLPYIYAYLDSNDEDKVIFESMHKKELSPKEQEWMKDKLYSSGAIDKTKELITNNANEALRAIENEDSESLVELIEQITKRIR